MKQRRLTPPRTDTVRLRVREDERALYETSARAAGFDSLSAWIRDVLGREVEESRRPLASVIDVCTCGHTRAYHDPECLADCGDDCKAFVKFR